jgi:tartrate-resistant acid phosphatase type 5
LRKYMSLGNHDHFGNVSAQIAYTGVEVPRVASEGRRATRDVTPWYMPAAYYAEDLPQHTRLIVTDSTMLIHELSEEPEESEQWRWLQHQVQQAVADPAITNLLLVTHHPILGAAEYSGNRKLVQYLMPLLEEAVAVGGLRVVHCAGHSHTLQHLRHNGVDYVVTGAASQVNMRRPNWFNVPLGSLRFLWPPRPYSMGDYPPTNFRLGGFVTLEATVGHANLRFFNASGALLYSQQLSS